MKRIKTLKCYLVTSPEIYEIVPVLDYWQGPKEYYKCWAYVEAFTKEDAKIKALKEDTMRDWVKWQRDDRCNPFTGLKVEEVDYRYCDDEFFEGE